MIEEVIAPQEAPLAEVVKEKDDLTIPVAESDKPEILKEAKPKAERLSPSFSYTRNQFKHNSTLLQPDHMTKEERFPLIFDSAKKLYPTAKRILSFGCSTGEECQALARRFPDSEIVGVDIDFYSIQRARSNNKSNKIFFHTDLGATGKYDLITALMVFFCMDEPIPKKRFVDTIQKLDKYLNPNGILMIYTSDHDPKEVLGDVYEDLNVWRRIHNKNQKEYFNGYYRKKCEGVIYETKLDIDPATMPAND